MAVTAEMVKALREETGAAILDCKKALDQYDGDLEKAKAYLAEKGLATAKKKEGRVAREGIVEAYQHTGGRVGVMVELNCETDFVANTDQFKQLAHDLALHIAFASPLYVSREDIPAEVVAEKKVEFQHEAEATGKPANVVEKIVEGKLDKYLSEISLLDQSFVKDDEVSISEILTKAIGDLRENIRVSRFARFELGDASGDEEGGGEE
jgi:elongation factor Ts